MLLATVGEELAEATESGPRRATCPGCDSEVVAKTGEVVRWHWAHVLSHPFMPRQQASGS